MKKRVSKTTARKKQKSTPKSPASSSTRLLTAEGWKRLMMKKHRH